MTAETSHFASPAWLLLGYARSSAMGQLVLDQGRLTFQVGDDLVFALNRSDIEQVVFPWYYFSGGMKMSAKGTKYRVSFVKPNGAEVATANLAARAGSVAALGVAISKFADVASGRSAGKRWRELLDTRSPRAE